MSVTEVGETLDSTDTLTVVAQVRVAALESHKTFIGNVKRLRNIRNAPFVCDANDIQNDLRFLVFSQLCPISQSVKDEEARALFALYHEEGTLDRLVKASSSALLNVAEEHIGTHTAKIPNNRVSSPSAAFWEADVKEAARLSPYVSSATFKSSQPLGAAGNAALLRAQRLLTCRITIRDEIKDFALSIAHQDDLFDHLCAIGFPVNVLTDISGVLRSRMTQEQSLPPPDGLARQVIWPTLTKDVSITPVHPYAIHLEMSKRLEARRREGRYIPTHSYQVGGSNPVNSGLHNSDLAGRHILIKAFPPVISERILREMQAYRALHSVPFGWIDRYKLSELTMCMKEKRNNRETRLALLMAIRLCLVSLLTPLARVRDYHDLIPGLLAEIETPSWVPVVLELGFGKVAPDIAADAVRSLTDQLLSEIELSLLGAGEAAVDFRKRVESVASELLSDIFEG